MAEVLAEQEVTVTSPKEFRKGPAIRKSPGTGAAAALNNSRAPAGKVVRPMRKVLTSGGRGMNTPSSGSNSASLSRSRSRLNLSGKREGGAGPSNLVAKTGVTSFLPSKPKGPTLEEIQEQKEDERKRKEEKEEEAKSRREEMIKQKADQQREKREERIRRVQEARQKQEGLKEDKLRKNQEKDKAEKLSLLKKREEMQKAEAKRRHIETEAKLKEAEDRRLRDQEERLAKQEKLENERREEEKRKEDKRKEAEDHKKMLKNREEEERKKKISEEKKRKQDEQRKEEEERLKREEDKRKLEEEKKKAQAHAERIVREKEELKKIKEREAARLAEAQTPADLNSTYEKPVNKALNKTQTQEASKTVNSYDMTPAKHDLPPEPLKDENNYGLEDLNSDGDTDDEECPRKEVPKWAEGTNLRTALLKQCYMPPDLDDIFSLVEMPDLADMFEQHRKRFFKRTSSACWEQPPNTFKHSKRL